METNTNLQMDNQEKGKNPVSCYYVKLADVDVNRICAPDAVEAAEYVSFSYLYDLSDGSRIQAPLRIEFPKTESDKILTVWIYSWSS